MEPEIQKEKKVKKNKKRISKKVTAKPVRKKTGKIMKYVVPAVLFGIGVGVGCYLAKEDIIAKTTNGI